MPLMPVTGIQAVQVLPQVKKRDGQTIQVFDFTKVRNAIRKAWLEAEGVIDEDKLVAVTNFVASTIPDDVIGVEEIQDLVEAALMRKRLFKVAKAYIVYRHERSEKRKTRHKPDEDAVANYVHFGKYARHQPDLLRREVYLETVSRTEDMHLRRFAHIPGLAEDITWSFDRVREKRVLPSMRSMQFGGKAIESVNNRIYNCTFSFVDRPKVFAEALYLLLCGSGVGFSVQYEHVDQLPPLKHVDLNKVVHHTVADTVEGWADALHTLFTAHVDGFYVEFNFSKIRDRGTPLKTSGGLAPGHRRLKESLEQIRKVLEGAAGRKLRPIECYDIFCHAADAVLSGGIRRSAMICLFSLEDSEMVYAKTGRWYDTHPWRTNSNNSVMLKRDEVKKKQFKRIYQMVREWGEPGFYFCSDYDHGANPCVEIGLNPKLTVDAETRPMLEGKLGKEAAAALEDGQTLTGWAFCNLCELNAKKFTSAEDFLEAAKAATIIGTLQASYTSMPYLGWVSEIIAEREALLGIGMTGMLDSPAISTDPATQRLVAESIKKWNAEYAAKIGIRPAARTTCVKPSGTTSLELGCVASGHHAHHAKRYIRRVTANELEVGFQAFRKLNPHMCVRKPNGDWAVEFPVEAPEGAIVKEDLTALSFLAMVKSTQENWVLPGVARPASSPGLTHNVSNTIHVREDEWDAVAEFIWQNREFFTGVALIQMRGDKDYAFAPNEAVVTEADEARWNQLVDGYVPLDYSSVLEMDDGTSLTAEAACSAGGCEK